MTLAEKVAELQAGGLVAARRILDAILRPTKVETTAPVDRAAPVAERALRDLVVQGNLMTLPQWNNRAAAGTLENSVKSLLAARLRQAATDADTLAALRLAALVENQEALIRRKGGEPYAPAAGNDTRSETTTADGPSWWATNFPGQPAPTLAEIRNLMGA